MSDFLGINNFEIQVTEWIDDETDTHMIKFRYFYKDKNGLPMKRGLILRVSPQDLPLVPEAAEYPQYHLGYLIKLAEGGH